MGWRYRNTRNASLVLCILLLPLSSQPLARTWRVPSECHAIGAGLDPASYGDTVLVAPGTYVNTIYDPDTQVEPGPGEWLIGEGGPEVTVIEMCTSSVGVVLHNCEGARVSGFTIRYGSDCPDPSANTYGIWCSGCTDVIVEDCIIEHVNMGFYVDLGSSGWWWPVFRNNTVRYCSYGIYCIDMFEPGRPLFEGNTITECGFGAEIQNSGPKFDANEISYCRHWAMSYAGHCGGNCTRNVIAYNEDGGVWVYADPPLATPGFNGGFLPEEGNDFYGNGGYDIHYQYAPASGQGLLMALYNYWGSDCPDFSTKIYGEYVNHFLWLDSTHTVVLNEDDCPGATEPTTWGSIKAMFR